MRTNKWFRQVLCIGITGFLLVCTNNLIAAQGKQATSICQSAKAGCALDLYISNDGNDAWSGRFATADRNKSDGPFKTLQRARDEIRRRKQARAVTVNIRGGDYLLPQTFELSSQDSGTKDCPVTYQAYENETVRLIGGRRITNFKPVTDPAILKRLDGPARGNVMQADLKAAGISDFGEVAQANKTLELFFQNKPMTLARWPNDSYVKIADVVGGKPFTVHGKTGDKIGKFTYSGDRPKRWQDENDIHLRGYWFWDWASAYQKVESIDTEKCIINIKPPYHHYGYMAGHRFYALNILAELNLPGQWYLDRKSAILYFWPPAEMAKSEILLSMLETVISMTDASYITLDGLTIGFNRGTAVAMNEGEHNKIIGCTLRNIGGKAVVVKGGTNHTVADCQINNTGLGGVELIGGNRKKLIPANHTALNNHIHNYCRLRKTYATAVSAKGVGCRIAHNLIHDAPHMAIGISGNDHIIEYNEVYNVCTETDDAGAFYMGRDWTWRGNIVRYNYFHHIGKYKSHCGVSAIYLDDWSSDVKVYGNICYKIYRAVLVGGGRDNIVENNIFIDCDIAVHIDSRGLGWAKSHFDGTATTLTDRLNAMPYKQSPWSQRYPQLLTLYDDEPALAKYNKVVCNISSGCQKWLDLRDGLTDKVVEVRDNWIDKDPLFVDRKNEDFRLRADSPAFTKGFQKIPIEKIGLYNPCESKK